MQARRRFAVAGIAAAVGLSLGFNLQSVLAVPQAHRSTINRLADELEARGIERVYASGFRHESRYRGRQEPLSSYYLLGIQHAKVIDCGSTLACLSSAGEGRAALVVGNSAIAQGHDLTRLAAVTPWLEIWVVRPDLPPGYEKLE